MNKKSQDGVRRRAGRPHDPACRMVWEAVLALVVLCFAAASSRGGEVYVAPTGNDTWPGTLEQPFKTIGKAISAVTAGDTIWVRGGTHVYTTTISISRNGTVSAMYHLFAYPGERPLLDFSSMAVSGSNRGISLSGSYWYVRGLDVKGAGDNGMHVSGSYNTIENCAFYENRDSGLQLSNGASYNQVINCDSYYNADTSQGNADGFSPKLDVGTGNYFYGCRAWQNSDDGFDGYLRPSDDVTTTYEKCWTFKNGYLKDGTPSAGNGNGFKMGGSDDKTLRHNVIMKDCLAFDNRVKGFDQNNNMGSMTLYNCTAYNNGTNYKIDVAVAPGKTVTLINCVALGAYGSLGAFVVQQTNSWMPPFIVTTADFQSLDPSPAYGPRNADGTLPDMTYLHLAGGSDLIDAGTYVGLTYYDAGPDLGAFETSGVSTFVLNVIATYGTVAKTPDSPRYDSNATVQLEAVSDSGYHFARWSGSDVPAGHASDNPLVLVMDADKSVTAEYTLNPPPPLDTAYVPLAADWNMVSVPPVVSDNHKSMLFPDALSHAFAYAGNYVVSDLLENGRGYWLKFPSPDTIPLIGTLLVSDTISVVTGWNMIGSISSPVNVASIQSIPGGLVTSEFYTYDGSYITSATIEPGRAYWVRVDVSGQLVLSAPPTASASDRAACIRIQHIQEQPPPPPEALAGNARRTAIPAGFHLGRNHPNPFNPTTRFEIALPQTTRVEVSVFNLIGEKIAVLMEGERAAGYYTLTWNGTTTGGRAAGSGVYIVRMSTDRYTAVQKMLLMK